MMGRLRSCWKVVVVDTRLVAVLALLLLAFGAYPLLLKAENSPRAAISSSRRFIVWSSLREESTLWSVWAENAVGELSDIIGAPPPLLDSSPLYIHILSSTEAGSPPVEALQSYPNGKLLQRLLIDRDRKSESEALAGLCKLLCNRYAIVRQRTDERVDNLASIPDWLSIGLALNMPSANRRHYRELAAAVWRRGEMPSTREILSFDSISGRATPEQEAVFFAFVHWLISSSHLSNVFSASAAGRGIGINELLAACPNVATARGLEESRDITFARIDLGGEFARRSDPMYAIAQLGKLLKRLPSQYSLLAKEEIGMGDLVRFRDSDWMDELCMRSSIALNKLSVTKDSELRAIIDMYIDIFKLLPRPAGNIFARLSNETASDRKIKKMIAKAGERLRFTEKRYQLYNSYLDKVEDNLYNPHGTWRYAPTEAEIKYVDQFEERYLQP